MEEFPVLRNNGGYLKLGFYLFYFFSFFPKNFFSWSLPVERWHVVKLGQFFLITSSKGIFGQLFYLNLLLLLRAMATLSRPSSMESDLLSLFFCNLNALLILTLFLTALSLEEEITFGEIMSPNCDFSWRRIDRNWNCLKRHFAWGNGSWFIFYSILVFFSSWTERLPYFWANSMWENAIGVSPSNSILK